MRTYAIAALLVASICWGQQPLPQPAPIPAPTPKQTITIPAGTRIPLSLAGSISTKARSGDAVRAVTGFPVTVDTQLAIPVGTYVEGVIDKVTKGGRSGPSLQVHFNRILFANGYSVAIHGVIMQAEVRVPKASSPAVSSRGFGVGPNYALAMAALPQLPTFQPPPSHTGAIVAVAVAGAAASIVALILMVHHTGSGNGVLFDTGWQFEMVLESPVTMDATGIAAAAASSAQ